MEYLGILVVLSLMIGLSALIVAIVALTETNTVATPTSDKQLYGGHDF